MSIQPSFRSSAISTGVAIALGLPSVAMAQSGQQPLEEVIVTATKRSASVQDVSLSVTAFSADDLRRGGIEDISRLEYMVPGLKFGQSGNEVRLAMRGTRTNNVGTEAEQVIGIFEDGVYVPTTTQALGSYVDLARVEVLRGPQGTLYGRNTFGGTVNIHTRAPSLERVEGYVTGLYGDYDRRKLEGAINLPLMDSMALRVAGMLDEHDGYIENKFPGVDDLRDQDMQYIRGSVLWAPTDSFDATLRVSYMDQSNSGDAIWGYQQTGGYIDGEFRRGHLWAPDNASDNFDNGPWEVRRDLQSNADLESTSYTLSMNWDVGPVTVRFIGNMTDFEGEQNYDSDYSDGGDPDNNGFTGWASTQDTWSTELQILSNGSGPLEWMLGAYYFEQESDWTWLEKADGSFEVPHWDRVGEYTSDSIGYFANATYALTDDVRLIGGYRYAEDNKQKKDQLDWSVWPPVPAPGSGEEGGWDDNLWKAGIEFDIDEDSMTYAQASTGYRAGGINFIADGVPLTYDPETVTAYEVGYKSSWMNNRLIFNVAAYYNQYEDMQAQSFAVLNEVVSEFTESGGEVDTAGVEVEVNWAPDEHWQIAGTLAYMDAEFGDYDISKISGLGSLGGRQDPGNPESLLSLKGWTPALSPEWTASLQASYDWILPGGSILTPLLQMAYSDDYYSFDVNVDGALQDAHTIYDARLIWTTADARIEVQGYVLNIGDEEVMTRSVIFNPGEAPDIASIQTSWNNPRVWGLSATYNF
jgi:outer membrane receptor protein involved in Fe transport